MGRAEYFDPVSQTRKPIKSGSVVNDLGLEYTPDQIKTIEDAGVALNTRLANVTNDKQMPIAGSTFTGIAKAQNNTSYTIPQLRNISSGTADPSGGSNGDIYFKRKV